MALPFLYAYTTFYIGRVHELFVFLVPLRIVLLLGVASVVLALIAPEPERNRLFAQREVRVVAALAGLGIVLMPLGVWPGASWTFLVDSYSRVLVFFALIVAMAASASAILNLVRALIVGAGLLGVFTLKGASLNIAYGAGAERAYASSTYDPNDVALIMVCTLPLAAFGAFALQGAWRLILAGTAAVCVIATILTVSRGGFIGLLLVAVMLMFRLGTAAVSRRVVILAVVGLLLTFAAPARYWDVMSTIWSPKESASYVESGVFSRIEVWRQGLTLFLDNPVTGVGIGLYEIAEGLSHGGRGLWKAAHNSFIQLATELGIFGFVLFVTLLALSVRNARRTLRATRGGDPELHRVEWVAAAVEISLYAYVVVGFALSQAYSPLLYFLVGIATALRLETERRAAAGGRRTERAPRNRRGGGLRLPARRLPLAGARRRAPSAGDA